MKTMKNLMCIFVLIVISAFSVFAEGQKDEPQAGKSKTEKASDTFTGSYFTGDGGAGIKLQIDELKLSNMDSQAAWLPEFAINMVSDDIAKYSNIEVIDTHSISRVENALAHDESAIYSEEDAIEVGNFSVARYIMLMTITGKGNNCAFSVRINDKEHNTVAASYNNPNCKISDLESSKALKEAVVDLLGQMNVQLTDGGKKAMLAVKSTENTATINAQKNVAQGVVAMNNGSEIEAISYFIKARSSDKNLARIDRQLNQSFDVVTSNDFASKARNLIAVRKSFMQIIEDIKKEFEKNPPFVVVFDPQLEADTNKINYEKESVPVTVRSAIYGLQDAATMLNRITNAIMQYPEWRNWGVELPYHPNHFPYGIFPKNVGYYHIAVPITITNASGKELGRADMDFDPLNFYTNAYNHQYFDRMENGLGLIRVYGSADVHISAYADTSKLYVRPGKPYYWYWDAGQKAKSKKNSTGEVIGEFDVNVVTIQEYAENYMDFPFSLQNIEGTNLKMLYFDSKMNSSLITYYLSYYNTKCEFLGRSDLMIQYLRDESNLLSTSPNTENICSFYSKKYQKIVPVSELTENDAKAFSNFINSVYTPRVSNYSHSYPNVYFSDIVVSD